MRRPSTRPFHSTGTGGSYYITGGRTWIQRVKGYKWRLASRGEGTSWIVHGEFDRLADAIQHYRNQEGV
jgi:hypothetical protein